jgi:hypothetical protein
MADVLVRVEIEIINLDAFSAPSPDDDSMMTFNITGKDLHF